MAESAGAGASSVAKGYIRYNASAQKAAFPSIITVAGVLDAIPLEDGNPAIAASGAPMLLDALQVRVQYVVPMHKLLRMSAHVYAAECVCLSVSAFQYATTLRNDPHTDWCHHRHRQHQRQHCRIGRCMLGCRSMTQCNTLTTTTGTVSQ